jgi:hypothetical protein
MRVFLLAAVVAATAACGAYQFPGSPAAQTGHVSGTVLVFPCAPVEQQGQPCRGLLGAGLEIVFTNGSDTFYTTIGQDAHYSIDLPAGTWKVTFKGIARIISGPNPINVPAGGSIEADYQVDSGIRAPGAPAAAS